MVKQGSQAAGHQDPAGTDWLPQVAFWGYCCYTDRPLPLCLSLCIATKVQAVSIFPELRLPSSALQMGHNLEPLLCPLWGVLLTAGLFKAVLALLPPSVDKLDISSRAWPLSMQGGSLLEGTQPLWGLCGIREHSCEGYDCLEKLGLAQCGFVSP